MRKLILCIALIFSAASLSLAQENYDEALAKKLGADEYGMKKYVIAFLYRGDRVSEYSEAERAEIQNGHMANINKLAEEGKLVLAGPFFGNEELRGLFFFSVGSIDEAKALTESDPAVKAGVLKMELKEWYATAALGMVVEISEKIARKNF
ncbi:MAG: YciI family protein [Algoriphagus sp.]|nr:YciI family protein [Algoriphagus sp.]